ncbi:unnamed protein product (macronuclear) [Paramecium tetraurelia]|uniref:Uncharacterized protein n=1 Tax=Paramecium tetraurelia TaxID=5888 RepID=A0CBM8_PARTE|nr:uncharacterized protein GSPATT00036978001 [Paramecium tetraurelia]CAK68195.1 unnamed protein product [Paramecium tetraurelia]|eukprot:XP_001435592.1 hypothetical protein (macronuclear) [Paramecium tetraurelia strain d4-2]
MIKLFSFIGFLFTVLTKLIVYEQKFNHALNDWVNNNNNENLNYQIDASNNIQETPKLNENTIIQRFFKFPPHNQLFIDINIILNRALDLVVQIGNKKYLSFAQYDASNPTATCKFTFVHLYEIDVITISAQKNPSQLISFDWALKQISIYIEECPATCSYCPDLYGVDACSQFSALFPFQGLYSKEADNWIITPNIQNSSTNQPISSRIKIYYNRKCDFLPTCLQYLFFKA